jgi:hypothetical protein
MTAVPQPPPQQSSGSGCLKWFLIGCSALIVLGIAFVVVLVFVVFAGIKSTGAYKGARDRAVNDPRVIEQLGSPVETGWWVMGKIEMSRGEADLDFPIHGPKGKATVLVRATRDGDRWVYTRLMVEPDNGPPIDLLPTMVQ